MIEYIRIQLMNVLMFCSLRVAIRTACVFEGYQMENRPEEKIGDYWNKSDPGVCVT